MKNMLWITLLVLTGCALLQPEKEVILCFETQEEAAKQGMQIFSSNFTSRTRYWLDGTNESIKGLGLQWRDLNNTDYCLANQYPLVVIYQPKGEPEFNRQQVLDTGKLTAKIILKEHLKN